MGAKIKHRCPLCHKIRRDPKREPDGNCGGKRRLREKHWVATPFGRFCGFCAERLKKEQGQ